MFPKNPRIEDPELLDRIRLSPCLACHSVPSDPHHVTTVKTGGGDTIDNVMSLCTRHHVEWHKSGPGTMCSKYPAVYQWLKFHKRDDVLRKLHRFEREQ